MSFLDRAIQLAAARSKIPLRAGDSLEAARCAEKPSGIPRTCARSQNVIHTLALLVAMLTLVSVSVASAQAPAPSPTTPAPSAPGTGPAPGTAPAPGAPGTGPDQAETPRAEPTLPAPSGTGPTVPVSVPALIGQNLLNPPPPQGPITLTPSITISEEFNDNIFQDNSNRKSDFITGFTPGVTLTIQRPEYRWNAGYNFTAEIYAKETQLSNVANRQNLIIDGFYQLSPTVTFTLNELFIYDRNPNVSSPQGFSSGREPSLSNTLSPGLTIQATPLTDVRVFGSYQLQRFLGSDVSSSGDSDIIEAGAAVDRTLTPRLTGTASVTGSFLSVQGEDDAYAVTPQLGVTYRFTRTLSATIIGGPSVIFQSGETSISPAGTVSLSQRFKYGSFSFSYDQSVGSGGSFGGVTNNKSIGATLTLDSLLKGFALSIGPRYTMSDNVQREDRPNEEVKAFNVGVDATYQIARSIALFASYNYFHQRSDEEQSSQQKIDQNRVFVGIQFGYPFSFD
jgi:predicted porin